jgi:hypothetical protein
MISYFVTWQHKYTLTSFLRTWSNRIGHAFRIVPYEYFSMIKGIRPGAFIFSDIDRLQPKQLRDVERFCDLIPPRTRCPCPLPYHLSFVGSGEEAAPADVGGANVLNRPGRREVRDFTRICVEAATADEGTAVTLTGTNPFFAISEP